MTSKRIPVPCPQCGRPKDPRSALCQDCAKGDTGSFVCPHCGGPKAWYAATCRACQARPGGTPTFDPEQIDPRWAAEFAGFFAGDGCLVLAKDKGKLPRPIATIHLRADDRAVLDDIAEHLGSTVNAYVPGVTKAGYQAKPQVKWELVGWARVEPVVRLLLRASFPSLRLTQAPLMRQFIEWRKTIVRSPTAEELAMGERYRLQMHALHHRDDSE
jgi:hypothetical protein